MEQKCLLGLLGLEREELAKSLPSFYHILHYGYSASKVLDVPSTAFQELQIEEDVLIFCVGLCFFFLNAKARVWKHPSS